MKHEQYQVLKTLRIFVCAIAETDEGGDGGLMVTVLILSWRLQTSSLRPMFLFSQSDGLLSGGKIGLASLSLCQVSSQTVGVSTSRGYAAILPKPDI